MGSKQIKKGEQFVKKSRILAALLALVFLVGCSGSGGSGSSSNSTTAPKAEAPKQEAPAKSAEPAAAPKPKVLIVAQSGDVDSLDNDKSLGPSKASIILYSDWQWLGYKKVRAGDVTVVDTSEIVPRIVEKWETKDLPDGRAQYTLHVRKGMKHLSGNPITAHDLLFSLERRRAMKRDSLEKTQGFFEATSEYVKLVDDYTLQVTTRQPSRFFFQMWTQRNIYDSAKVKKEAGPNDPWGQEYLKKNAAGGGPFILKKWTPGVELEFEKNPNWWGSAIGEAVKLDKIMVRVIPSTETRVLLLRRGEIDIAFDLPQKEINSLRNVQGVKVISAPSTNQLYVGMNPAIQPFDNVKVRQAMNYAFPHKDAIDKVFVGAARRMTGAVQIGLPGSLDKPMYETDLDKAKALLAEAGFSSGLTVPLTYDGGNQIHEDLAVLFQANLAKIGVKAELQKMQTAQFRTATGKKSLPFFFYEALWWIEDAGYSLDLGFLCGGHNNVANYCDKALDKELEEVRSIRDDKERNARYLTINKKLVEQAPWVFVAHPNFNLAMRDNIDGYVYQNTQLHHLWLLDKK